MALGAAIVASPALAQPAATSVFSEVPGKPKPHYYEHVSTSPSDNGLTASDMNADGTIVVGGVNFGDLEDQRSGQAAVWSPEPDSLMYLADSLVDPESDQSAVQFYDLNAGDADEISYATFATDISAASLRIVGTADGFYSEGETHNSFNFQLPVYWNKTAGAWSSAIRLPVPETDATVRIGGANAISDAAPAGKSKEYIAGWSGWADEFTEIGERVGGPSGIHDVQATLWEPNDDGGWTPQRLGVLGEDSDSMANDVNDLGQVVGWSGFAETYQDVLDGYTAEGPGGNWSPRPFVWTNLDDGMQALNLFNSPHEHTYELGEAKAISNSGNLAVGWVADESEGDGPPVAAAWTDASEGGDWTSSDLINLGETLDVPPDLGEAVPLAGSMAEAVDASGHLVVGKAVYDDDGVDENLAVYWQLDDQMNVVRAESIEGALSDAGVDLSGKDFPADGHRLTDATAVRVVNDEASGDPQSIVVTGTGTGSYGSWIAKLGKFAAITTPVSVGTTLTTIDKGTKSLAARFADFADNDYCARPAGASIATTPMCYFVSGGAHGYAYGTTAGGSLGTQFGVARYLDDDNSIGVSGGLDGFAGGGPGASSYTATEAVIGGYAAHMPDQGVQARVAVSLGAIIDATFERVYANGGGTSTSTGHTSGGGFGAVAHLAYATPIDELTTLMPYVELDYGAIHLGGYTESNGAFPGVFSAIDAQRLTASIGLDATHKLDATTRIFGGISLSGVYTSGTGVNASIAGLPFSAGTSPASYLLLTGTLGASMDLDPASVLSGQVRASTSFGGYSSAGVQVNYSHSF